MSKHPGGRPTDYCEEVVERICEAISTNAMGLNRLCEKFSDLPGKTTIVTWLGKYSEFRSRYLKAKATQAFLLLEESIDVANSDEEDNLIKINRAKLKIDTYKFCATRLNAKELGEKTHTVLKLDEDANAKVRENLSKYE